MPQTVVPESSFTINDMVTDNVKEFPFLSLILDSNLNWNAHLNSIDSKIARVIGLLRKLKYMFPKHILCSIYNSLILPDMNYSLFAWGNKCNIIELVQKKAVRLINLKTPIVHIEPLLKKMKQVKLSDLYTCHLLKLYYKLYRNRLPPYFDNFLPEYGDYTHNLHNDLIHLPAIRCNFGAMNAKYQMHLRLREIANPSNPPLYPPMLINVNTLNMYAQRVSDYLKIKVTKSYIDVCIIF